MFKEILLLGVLASGSSLWQQCECDAMEVLVSITIPTCYIYVIYIPSTTLQLVVLLLQTFVHLSKYLPKYSCTHCLLVLVLCKYAWIIELEICTRPRTIIKVST